MHRMLSAPKRLNSFAAMFQTGPEAFDAKIFVNTWLINLDERCARREEIRKRGRFRRRYAGCRDNDDDRRRLMSLDVAARRSGSAL